MAPPACQGICINAMVKMIDIILVATLSKISVRAQVLTIRTTFHHSTLVVVTVVTIIFVSSPPTPSRVNIVPEPPSKPMLPLCSTKPSSELISVTTLAVGKRLLTSLGSDETWLLEKILRRLMSRNRGRYVMKHAQRIAADGSICDHRYVDTPESVRGII